MSCILMGQFHLEWCSFNTLVFPLHPILNRQRQAICFAETVRNRAEYYYLHTWGAETAHKLEMYCIYRWRFRITDTSTEDLEISAAPRRTIPLGTKSGENSMWKRAGVGISECLTSTLYLVFKNSNMKEILCFLYDDIY